MSVPLDSLVGEVHLIEGVRQSTTPATGVFTAPRRAARGREDDMLYVLIDLLGDVASSDLYTITDQLTHAYWAMPGSVTSALRAALNAAGGWLLDHNGQAPLPERLTGGIVCAVLRGSSIYIAQAGPTNVFVTHGKTSERYPAPDAEPMPLIGTARAVDVRFAHVDMKAGDTILLTDARVAQHVSAATIHSAISGVKVEKALEQLEQLLGKGDLIALVAQAAPSEGAELDKTAAAVAATVVAATVIPEKPPEPPVIEVRSPPSAETPVTTDGPIIRIAGRPSPATTAVAGAQLTRSDTPSNAAPPRPASSVQTDQSATKAAIPAAATPSAIGEWSMAIKQSLRRGAASMGAAGRIVADRTTPDSAQARPKSLTRNQTMGMVVAAIAIPVIVVLLVAMVYTQRSAQEAVLSHIAGAQNEMTLAEQAVTGTETRQHWALAVSEAQAALKLEPQNATAAQLLQQAQTAVDKIDNVITLSPVLLWDFKSVGQQHLAAQGAAVFVLDRTANQVNRAMLNSAGDKLDSNPEPILVPGMTVNNETPGNLLDVVSMASSISNQASDVIIGHQKGLVEYSPAFGLQTLPFGSNTLSSALKRIRSFDGKLYILQPETQQIMKYEPTGDGYTSAPVSYLGQPRTELAAALDMAIDGSVYVSLSNGKILKFADGQAVPFEIHGLGEPLRQPTIMAVDENAQDSALYVFDAATQRIVQLRPDGLFVRQFRAADAAFDNLQDLLVDEQNARLHFIGKGVFSTVTLPPLR